MYITNPNIQNERNTDNDLIYFNKKKLNTIYSVDKLDKKIECLCEYIFLSSGLSNTLNPYKEPNCYELFGLDIMLDNKYKLWLLEINASPGMETITSSVLKKIISDLLFKY
jgi:hypothetical protein